jgi:hypothetical protein
MELDVEPFASEILDLLCRQLKVTAERTGDRLRHLELEQYRPSDACLRATMDTSDRSRGLQAFETA